MNLRASGEKWAVATPHTAATEAAGEAFERGGDAVDAALAAAMTLAVVYPHMCGVGGDLLALVRRPDGTTSAVISAGTAPLAIDPEAVRARHDGRMPEHGPDTITVPGAVAGWETLHGIGARLPWSEAFAPAIDFAESGAPVAGSLAATLADDDGRLTADPGLASVFFPKGEALTRDAVLRQPALAATLRALARAGSEALYRGDVGAAYSAGLRLAGSALADDDLSAHRSEVLEATRGRYRALDILVAPPPSQGFVLLQILALVERLGLHPDPQGVDAPSLANIFATTARDRDRNLADPNAMQVTVADLLGSAHLDSLAATMGGAGREKRGTGDTISLVTADAEGWAVSLIQSLYRGFGSGILEPNTGIVAHDRGACFTLETGHPNELAPGKRPAHTLMPVLVERQGSLVGVAGTMGGEAQPQINASNLMRVFDLGMPPGDALSAPRWTVEGSQVFAETGIPAAATRSVADGGFEIRTLDGNDGTVGHSNLIEVTDATFRAAADPRADGSAAAG